MNEDEAFGLYRYERLLDVYRGMVGTLYPSIAYRELCELWEEHESIRRRFGHPHPPRSNGASPGV